MNDLPADPEPELTAYLLVGHGTRNIQGQRQFQAVYHSFAELMVPCLTGFAYLELAEPDIDQAIARLAERGAKFVRTVPVLLFAAGHAQQDIPRAVAAASSKHGLHCVGQSDPLELNSAIIQLSALRFRQAVCQAGPLPSCWQACQANHCPQVALAMIGRGSRSTSAAEQMRQFSRLRRALTPVAQIFTGFVYAQRPSVPEILAALAASPLPTIVVQPHLLFEGELIEQLRLQVAAAAAAAPAQRWVITDVLGTDFALAETLAHLANEGFLCK